VENLIESLKIKKVPQSDRDEIVKLVSSFKNDILGLENEDEKWLKNEKRRNSKQNSTKRWALSKWWRKPGISIKKITVNPVNPHKDAQGDAKFTAGVGQEDLISVCSSRGVSQKKQIATGSGALKGNSLLNKSPEKYRLVYSQMAANAAEGETLEGQANISTTTCFPNGSFNDHGR